ncbi:SDR family NAD(P)-dependent oxidoreductase, partial [Streptococcus sobrinus]
MTETVMITGASAGFGLAMARLFVQKGYRVIGTGRRLAKLEELAQELGDNFYPLQMDMTSQEVIDSALASLAGDWGKIDILVNNA